MVQATQAMRLLRAERKKIVRIVESIQGQLDRIDSGELSANHPYVGLRSTAMVEKLRSPHKNLQAALLHDLALLRQQLKELGRERRAIWLQSFPRSIAEFRAGLEKQLVDIVEDSAAGRDEAASEKLQIALDQADQILDKTVALLKSNPSTANIKSVLGSLADVSSLGGDPGTGNSAKAMESLLAVGAKRHKEAGRRFRKMPTVENLTQLFAEEGFNQALGGDVQIERHGWSPAGNVHHPIGARDTLSGLSKKYYGSTGYWDVIYLANLGIVGSNPDRMPARGTILVP